MPILQYMVIKYIPIDDDRDTDESHVVPELVKRKASPLYDKEAFRDFAREREEYFQVERKMLIPGTEITFPVFVADRFTFTPLIEATEVSPVGLLDTLDQVSGDLLIRKADIPEYTRYVDRLLHARNDTGSAGGLLRAFSLREQSKIVLKELLENPRSGEGIKKSSVHVVDRMECLLDNREALHNLLTLKNFDHYTYTHSVNVAVLSIGLGITNELPRDELRALGIGAMLHDVGKSAVPVEIVLKQGKLSKTEYDLIKKHVVEGEKILRAHAGFPEESLSAVLQHHEKLTGSGYPYRLSGDEIVLFGRIAGIADCYDALTTRRP
ncbi:MAG TPA: HD domain-containing phosphohydrolase, partial [Dissulfurispiraceae bacterium]|nr:HD domain-containing phosphohydrolase [Dissulfurispiraceae bacterium]